MNIGIFEGGPTPLAPNIWTRFIHYTINLYGCTIHKMQSTWHLGGRPGAKTYPDNTWWDFLIKFPDCWSEYWCWWSKFTWWKMGWNCVHSISGHKLWKFCLRLKWGSRWYFLTGGSRRWDFLMTGRVLATAVTQAGICGSLGWSPGFAAAGNTAQDYYTFASAVIRYFTIYSCWTGGEAI